MLIDVKVWKSDFAPAQLQIERGRNSEDMYCTKHVNFAP